MVVLCLRRLFIYYCEDDCYSDSFFAFNVCICEKRGGLFEVCVDFCDSNGWGVFN